MKKRLIFLWNEFCVISTCVLTAVALSTTILFPIDVVSPNIFWQILLVSALCTASTLLYPWDRKMNKTEFCIRVAIHYILINVIVLGFGSRFEWYQPAHFRSILSMLITIAVIFAIVSFISWSLSAKDAKKMNERLEQYQESLYTKESDSL